MNIITLINVIETNDKYIPYNIYIYIYIKKMQNKYIIYNYRYMHIYMKGNINVTYIKGTYIYI